MGCLALRSDHLLNGPVLALLAPYPFLAFILFWLCPIEHLKEMFTEQLLFHSAWLGGFLTLCSVQVQDRVPAVLVLSRCSRWQLSGKAQLHQSLAASEDAHMSVVSLDWEITYPLLGILIESSIWLLPQMEEILWKGSCGRYFISYVVIKFRCVLKFLSKIVLGFQSNQMTYVFLPLSKPLFYSEQC